MEIAGKFLDALKGVAGAGMNQLPDRFNLFARYLTGVGNKNLKLDRSTEQALIRATEKFPTVEQEFPKWESIEAARMGEKPIGTEMIPVPAFGPGFPGSGPTIPYGLGEKAATQTLGRFNAEVTPKTVRVKDTYDMVNEFEDPDLVSGKFQPRKALNLLTGTFIPGFKFDRRTGGLEDYREFLAPEEQGIEGIKRKLLYRGQSDTESPMTDVARSLMYALPVKFKPYEIDYTIQR
jgi:hypothetical protein